MINRKSKLILLLTITILCNSIQVSVSFSFTSNWNAKESANYEHEALISEVHPTLKLPRPTSDLTSTYSIAPYENGSLGSGIYLLGGCISNYISKSPFTDDVTTSTKPSSQDEKNKHENEYICPQVSNQNMVCLEGDYFESRKPMPRPRYRHTSTSVQGKIWVVGGRDEKNQIVSEVDIYDPIKDSWITLFSPSSSSSSSFSNESNSNTGPDTNSNGGNRYELAVSDHAAFAIGKYLFVTGGYTQDYIALKSTIAIHTEASLAQNQLIYRSRALLNHARGDVHAAIVSLAVSKENKDGEEDSPSMMTALPVPMVIGGFTHLDGYCRALSSVEIYDLERNEWKIMKGGVGGLSEGRADVAIFVYGGGKVFVLGGERRGLEYDIETGMCIEDSGGATFHGSDAKEWTSNLELNQRLPRRRTFPVKSVEVLDLSSLDRNINGKETVLEDIVKSKEWNTIKGDLPDFDDYGANEKYRFAVATWPDKEVVYVFGGIRKFITGLYEVDSREVDSVTATGSGDDSILTENECVHYCLELSDLIFVYKDEMERDYILSLSQIVVIAFSSILTLLIIARVIRWFSLQRKDFQPQRERNAGLYGKEEELFVYDSSRRLGTIKMLELVGSKAGNGASQVISSL